MYFTCKTKMSTGEGSVKKVKDFYFEKHWLLEEGFLDMLISGE
jgi:hypothetical protein